MQINRIQTERIQEPAVCPICDTLFSGHAVTIDQEQVLYCSHRCAFFELELREQQTLSNQVDVWNPLLSTYESAS